MGWPPAVVIVVRHGARLDAADRQWHLTSPTPYDPPLTYGGWTQSRALGARIANILRTRETDDEIPAANDGEETNGDRRKRRHKVIIHSSPFLRCVQTSVAISAGLAQNPGHIPPPPRPGSSTAIKTLRSASPRGSPRVRPTIATGSPRLAPITEPCVPKANGKPQEQPENIKRSTIRVDAWLGEWLSPDYFDQITPPPSSIMMVAGAKADLLRREDYSNLIHVRDTNSAPSNQPFPGGWGSPIVVTEDKEDSALLTLSSLGTSLPRRDRGSSLSSIGSRHSGKSASSLSVATVTTQSSGSIEASHGIYQAPIPSYAISNSDPIPAGYVAHARDACVDVDYQWDSMREPQCWGNGGEYGEEWSSMHKRFRNGLQHLVGWYRDIDNPGKLLTKAPLNSPSHPNFPVEDDVDDENTDLVIILVSHGAGCNALIGALTNQPVLMDVGMASLTMAVRKPTPKNTPTSTPGATPKSHSRASSKTLAISDEYEVKLFANTDHLRSTSTPPSASRTPSLAGLPAFRDRYGTGGAFDAFSKPRPITTSTNSNFGSIRRSASVAGSTPRAYTASPRQNSIGLWSAPQPQEEVPDEQEDEMILNFGNSSTDGKEEDEEKENEEAVDQEHDEEDEVAPLGLWGSPRPPGYAEKIREIAPKRRWTVNERG